ncbi:ATP-dependent zinc protease [Vibrio sp. TH_r3]|uniref:ATP-dependent zinc protease family protein n=1 Tax=Vibrio sp. TH_r3 TaxID=3082084 RepID=UPI0029537C4F|nr:ATP-dependent zinc protease [Vibrio sp. TH_r3]MDV7103532.1 ATP-dependent zinc protease [Vibrio sp. TH_r3]
MNKSLLPVCLCFGLVACTSNQSDTSQQSSTDNVAKQMVVAEKTDNSSVSGVSTGDKADVSQSNTSTVTKEVDKPIVKAKAKAEPTKTEQGKLILGSEEWVYLPGLDKSFMAKVDTGATTSSISAVDILPFEREGKEWVKFRVEHKNISTDEISLPVLRWAKIKQANSTEAEKRPIVTAWIQVGDVKEKADFTLTDRKHLSYPVLLGQSYVRDIAVVDIGRKLVQPKKK